MFIERNILFFPDIEKGKQDAKLRMRIRWDRNVLNFNVGYRILPNKWVKEAQQCKRNTTNLKEIPASVINLKIQKLQGFAEDVFKYFELRNEIPTKDEFKILFNEKRGEGKAKAQSSIDFFSLFDDFTFEMGRLNNWKKATFTKMNTVKTHLYNFDSKLTFSKLDKNELTNLVYYLRENRDYKDSTLKKFLGFLKWYLKWSVQKGYNTNTDFETFKPKLTLTKSTIVYLYWDELMTVYNKEFSEDKIHLEKVRDVFCFCCFTSLRYSDVANLKKSDVYKNHIEITTVKTADALKIDLNDYSRALLEKYKDYKSVDNSVFPVISNQKMNENLKELAKYCELNRTISQTYYKGNQRFDEVHILHNIISTHAARRTFISNALIMGIPPQTVMQWTGHSDYSAMKPYIAIADKDRAKAMELFNK